VKSANSITSICCGFGVLQVRQQIRNKSTTSYLVGVVMNTTRPSDASSRMCRSQVVGGSVAGLEVGTVCQRQWELQRPWPHSGSNWRPSSIDSVSVKLTHSKSSPFYLMSLTYWLV